MLTIVEQLLWKALLGRSHRPGTGRLAAQKGALQSRSPRLMLFVTQTRASKEKQGNNLYAKVHWLRKPILFSGLWLVCSGYCCAVSSVSSRLDHAPEGVCLSSEARAQQPLRRVWGQSLLLFFSGFRSTSKQKPELQDDAGFLYPLKDWLHCLS